MFYFVGQNPMNEQDAHVSVNLPNTMKTFLIRMFFADFEISWKID